MPTKSKKSTAKSAAPPAKRAPAKRAAPKPSDGKQAGKPPRVAARVKVPFGKKNQPPSETEFLARLPLATGKKFEAVRSFVRKQKGVVEDLYYYGPKTGWAFRYLGGGHSLATIMIHDGTLMGILSLDSAALAMVNFASLSDIGQRAHKVAHGSPSLLWLDLPLDAAGASDFKTLLKAKLKTLPPPRPPPPPPPPVPARRTSRP